MTKLEKDVLRMEVQVGELIRIVANLNRQIQQLEEVNKKARHRRKMRMPHLVQ